MKEKILIVAAHPDDEVLGCGGTIARRVKEGCEAYTLILGEGITSRDAKRNRSARENEIENLKQDAAKANSIIGVKELFLHDFPDNRFDTVNLLDIVKVVEKVINDIGPACIYTHHSSDLNIDHRVTFSAVLTASRPLKGQTVKSIYSFEVPSSTEWNYPNKFNPNTFVNIEGSIGKKVSALKLYEKEIRSFPHPRSTENVEIIAKRWGSSVGLTHAEAFEAVRVIK